MRDARKDKSLIHKLFLFFPITGDLLPIILLILNPIFNFNAGWNDQETAKLGIRIWAFTPALVGLFMIVFIVWYFVIWKVKSFSNYAFIGIAFSIIGCLEPFALLYVMLLAFRNI
jgi:TRAP-type C4-dicarboxylate transport system permease large subunit